MKTEIFVVFVEVVVLAVVMVMVVVLVLVVVVVVRGGGQNYFKCLLCVSNHSEHFTVLAREKINNCQNRTD